MGIEILTFFSSKMMKLIVTLGLLVAIVHCGRVHRSGTISNKAAKQIDFATPLEGNEETGAESDSRQSSQNYPEACSGFSASTATKMDVLDAYASGSASASTVWGQLPGAVHTVIKVPKGKWSAKKISSASGIECVNYRGYDHFIIS